MSVRIIVFDHSPHLSKLFQVLFTSRGYQVIIIPDESLHIETVESLHPDLLVLGNLRGYKDKEVDLVYQMKSHPELQSIPILIITTAPQFVDMHLDYVEGIYTLAKPFDAHQLLENVRHILG